jgi:hypothetical protein
MASRCGRREAEGVFERFSDSARRVLVLAQEEARLLSHGFIGTEHLLLGLMHEGETGDALASTGVTLTSLREQISKTITLKAAGHPGSHPFTPRAKKVLELSLREMLGRGGANIEPGDLLLGLLREGEGVGVKALMALGVDLEALRQDVLDRLSSRPPEPAVRPGEAVGWRSQASASLGNVAIPPFMARGGGMVRRFESCALCGRDLWEVPHYVSEGSVMVCQVCIEEAAEIIQGAPAEACKLMLPPRLFGNVPYPQAPSEIATAVAHVVGPEPDEDVDPYLEDAEALLRPRLQAGERSPAGATKGIVRRIRFTSTDDAWVELVVQFGEGPGGFPFEGPVRLIDGKWKVTRELLATMLARVGVQIPPAR